MCCRFRVCCCCWFIVGVVCLSYAVDVRFGVDVMFCFCCGCLVFLGGCCCCSLCAVAVVCSCCVVLLSAVWCLVFGVD